MPVIAIATVTAVAGLVNTLVAFGKQISAIASAPEEAKEILRVVRSLQRVVQELRAASQRALSTIQDGGDSWEQSLNEIVDGIKDTIKQLQRKGVKKGTMGLAQRFLWTLSADDTRRYKEDLNQYTTQMTAMQNSLVLRILTSERRQQLPVTQGNFEALIVRAPVTAPAAAIAPARAQDEVPDPLRENGLAGVGPLQTGREAPNEIRERARSGVVRRVVRPPRVTATDLGEQPEQPGRSQRKAKPPMRGTIIRRQLPPHTPLGSAPTAPQQAQVPARVPFPATNQPQNSPPVARSQGEEPQFPDGQW
jgi:hypothetical protein